MEKQLLWAFVLSGVIVAAAYWRKSLSVSGSIGALVVGTIIFGLGGPVWGLLLGIFFVTSSALSHFKEREKRAAAEKFEKGHTRDIGQVIANGGLGALIAIFSQIWPSPAWFALFLGVMATVNADTWATELGTLSKRPPRLITTWRVVEVGTSGGVSALGTGVSFVGGLLLGLVAGWLGEGMSLGVAAAVGGLGGLSGSLLDSLMGATVQQIYYCDTCRKDTERKIHRCGTVTRPLKGWSWLNNDLVNLISSIGGGVVALGLWFLLR